MISRFPNRNRAISTPQLNILLRFHLVPINVIISYGPQTISNLGTGFPLRCFQRLSIPNIATGRSRWRESPYTRGSFTSVLSYQKRISSNINACSRQETNLSYASFHPLLDGTDYIFFSLAREAQRICSLQGWIMDFKEEAKRKTSSCAAWTGFEPATSTIQSSVL